MDFKTAISFIEFDKLPLCIVDIILDYFTKEIKEVVYLFVTIPSFKSSFFDFAPTPKLENILMCHKKKINTEKILEFDPQWMIELINIFNKNTVFCLNAKFGSNLQFLDNMKWLLENKFPYDEDTFAYAVKKWEFRYYEVVT